MKNKANKSLSARPAFARLVGTLLLAMAALSASAVAQSPADLASQLGPNVYIFDPSMSTSQIQATVDSSPTSN
ncbi:hypothetical protein [Tunturiibacter gelidoferens]|uniref:Uncharacterized protein n=1 Tax=Tunturiibacter gelidiferens TaxID=3069689 RepID=A0A9X0QGM5_9BACT|nr:hypothetical protein [Edaphobacter lichenicola]MBB5329865.1 hypothetical protein [Edaphobacter lichenicola]